MQNINESPTPIGQLISQTIAMPRETNSNGDKYVGLGYYKDSRTVRHGVGIQVYANGNKYAGQYNKNKRDG